MKKCVVCGSDNYSEVYDFGKLKYFKCKSCSLIKRTGKKEPKDADYHRDKDYEKFDEYYKNFFRKRYKTISKFKSSPGKVIDIGASMGAFLEVFKENGWEVLGIEPSGSAVAAEAKGIEIINKPLEKAKLEKKSFDAAVLNHTLEHLKNPVEALDKVSDLLKKDGVVFVDVPNFASLESKFAGRNWRYLLPEEHTYQFTPETLQKILESSRFEVVWQKTYSGIFGVDNPLYHFWYQMSSGKPHFYKNFVKDVLSVPFDALATALNQGTSLMMVGRKTE